MHPPRPKVESVDEYINLFPQTTQARLHQIRQMIKTIAPQASESISYAIPAYKINGRAFMYFAAYDSHISLHPVPSNIEPELKSQIAPHIKGKGTLQFPLNQPLPIDLINKIIYSLLPK